MGLCATLSVDCVKPVTLAPAPLCILMKNEKCCQHLDTPVGLCATPSVDCVKPVKLVPAPLCVIMKNAVSTWTLLWVFVQHYQLIVPLL